MTPNWCGCDPRNGFTAEAWFVRARHARGACPCCGYPVGPREPMRTIAEGVTICLGCAAPGHLRDSAGWTPLLTALVTKGASPTGGLR